MPQPLPEIEEDTRPIYYLWAYNPQDASVVITHNEDSPESKAVTHDELAPENKHPGRLNGYAYSIKGGYRITDEDGHKIEDPFVIEQIRKAIREEVKEKPKSHPRYHGKPT